MRPRDSDLRRLNPLYLNVGRPSTSPLDREVLRAHLAVDGTYLESLIDAYELAAITWAEDTMKRNIMSRRCRWVLANFPQGYNEEIRLPRGLCTTVDSVIYSRNGESVELNGPSGGSPAEGFLEDLHSEEGGLIMPNRGTSWPAVDLDVPVPVCINFDAGWPTADAVPADIKHALMFAIADMLEVRSVADTTAIQSAAASGRTFDIRDTLLSPYRLERIY